MSRTFLRDSQSTERVDPVYSYEGDLSLPPPKPKRHADSRMSLGNAQRQSQTPLPLARQPRDSLGQCNMDGAGSSFDGINDSIGMPNYYRGASEALPSSSDVTSLKTLVEHQGSLLAEMRSEMRELRMQRQETPRFQSMTPAIMPSTLRLTQTLDNDETNKLREENQNLKARLASIASAMGLDPDDLVGESSSERGERIEPSALGKRKRLEDEQLPTPHSTQGSNSDRDQYFARPQLPPTQLAPVPASSRKLCYEQWTILSASTATRIPTPPRIQSHERIRPLASSPILGFRPSPASCASSTKSASHSWTAS